MKQILTSKMLRKLLILSCLIVGLVFATASSRVEEAAAAHHDYDSCVGEAYDAYRECDYYCGTVVGTGACFGMCQTNLDNSLRDCETQYPQ
jgi:hypothetical protein